MYETLELLAKEILGTEERIKASGVLGFFQ
jgi:hypothetical protein